LKVCHWNIHHLTDSKLEEIRVKLSNPNNGEDKPDILTHFILPLDSIYIVKIESGDLVAGFLPL